MKRENSLFGRRSANFCYQTPGTPASPVAPGDGPDPTGSPALKTYKSEKEGEEAQLQHQPADERDLEQRVNQQQQQQPYRQQHQEEMAPQQHEDQNSPPEQHLRQQDQVLQEEEDDQMLLAEELRQRELYIHELQLRAHRIQEERRRLHEELRKEQEMLEDKERDQQMHEWIRREQERRRREQREYEAWEELQQRDRDYSPPGRGLQVRFRYTFSHCQISTMSDFQDSSVFEIVQYVQNKKYVSVLTDFSSCLRRSCGSAAASGTIRTSCRARGSPLLPRPAPQHPRQRPVRRRWSPLWPGRS